MTLIEVLAPFGVGEEDFVEELSRALRAAPDASASRLTEPQELVLRERGGISEPEGDDNSVRRAVLRASSVNLADSARESLTVEQAARALLVACLQNS